MSRQCPECHKVYGAQSRFCDLDGATLRPRNADRSSLSFGTKRKGRRSWIAMALGVGLLAGLFFFGQTLLRNHLRARFEMSFTDVFLKGDVSLPPHNSDAGLPGRLAEKLMGAVGVVTGNEELLARLTVKNPTFVSGVITGATYTLNANNQVIGQGAWNSTGSPIDFNAREDVELRFPFRLEPRQALAGLFDFTAAQPSLEMRGEMNVRVLFIPLTLPFEVKFVRAAAARKDQQSY